MEGSFTSFSLILRLDTKILSFTWNSANFRKKGHSPHCSCLYWRQIQGKRRLKAHQTEQTLGIAGVTLYKASHTVVQWLMEWGSMRQKNRLILTRGRILLLWIVLFKGIQLLGQVHVSMQAHTQEKRGKISVTQVSFGTILCSCVAKADDVPVWTSSSDGHRLSLFFPRKVADKRQGIQVADRVTCKCLSWAIYLSAFLAKRGDVCHSCQLCVIFPPCLSSSFIPWMEVLFYFLFLAQLAGAPLSPCLNGFCECANLASSKNG